MLPRFGQKRIDEKRRVRQREADLSVSFIREHLDRSDAAGPVEVLEFGCGAGYQVPSLQQMGCVTASDLVVDPDYPQADFKGRFHVCDIATAPYGSHTFDVIYSNHVLEHVQDVPGTLREISRLLRNGGVIAIGLPTPMWLLLSVPTQLADKVLNILRRVFRLGRGERDKPSFEASDGVLGTAREKSGIISKLSLYGHGQFGGFFECLSELRAKVWRRRFEQCGLNVLRDVPLLAYATVRWPIIPPNRWMVHLGIVSSRLYLLRPAEASPEVTALGVSG